MAQVVDVEHPVTWPPSVVSRARELSGELEGTAEIAGELRTDESVEDAFRSLLSGCLVRSYHATRLLDHEVQNIQEVGLRPLSRELVRDRIEDAFVHSYITADERDKLNGGHVFTDGRRRNRAGQVALFLPERVLRERVSGLAPLLLTWGGEGIYMGTGAHLLRQRLIQLGRPAIVVVTVDLSPGWRTHFVHPELHKLFVGRLLGLGDLGASVHYRAPVPPEQIISIWQPGDREYDRYDQLPRH